MIEVTAPQTLDASELRAQVPVSVPLSGVEIYFVEGESKYNATLALRHDLETPLHFSIRNENLVVNEDYFGFEIDREDLIHLARAILRHLAPTREDQILDVLEEIRDRLPESRPDD